ncbi:unnamed protein product [Sphagnum balticum]
MENKEFVDAMAEDKAENQIGLEVCGGGIAFITLNRPKALNDLTKDMPPGWRSLPRNWIRGLPSKSSFSQEQGELLALEWFSLSNMVDDGRI